jgi:hypothetical protein
VVAASVAITPAHHRDHRARNYDTGGNAERQTDRQTDIVIVVLAITTQVGMQTDRQTDGRAGGWTDGGAGGRTDRRHSPLVTKIAAIADLMQAGRVADGQTPLFRITIAMGARLHHARVGIG